MIERISAQGKRIAFVIVLLAALTGFLSFLLLAPRLPLQLGSEKSGEDLAPKMALLLGVLPKASAFVSVGALSRVHMAPTTIIACSSLGHYRTGTTPPRTARTSFIRYLTGGSSTRFASGTGLTMQSAGKILPKHVLVPVADGSEEIESVTIIDTLVRAGASVTVASVSENIQVTCSRGVKIVADCKLAECESREWDAIVCPGGLPGATNLKESEPLKTILKKQADDGRIVAAICAAPAVVLASHGLLEGKKATCYPADAFTSQIPEHVDEQVVVDGNTITSQGPATAMIFSLKLVESLFGTAKADEIGQAMLVP